MPAFARLPIRLHSWSFILSEIYFLTPRILLVVSL